MPDLGRYADAVLSAYAVSLVLIVGLVVMSVVKGRKARADLDSVEQRTKRNG